MRRLLVGISMVGLALASAASGRDGDLWDRVIAGYPEQARAFAAGADPGSLLLEDGTTLGELIARTAPAGADLLYTPVPPCRVAWTRASAAGRLLADVDRDLKVRPETVDLSAQGGSPAGCGVPAAAQAVMVVVRDLGPSAPGLLRGRAFGPHPWQALVYFTPHVSPPRFANSTILGLCTPQASCAADFSLRATAATDAVVEVVGYFLPLTEGPGSGLDADSVDGLDSADFAASTHGHAALAANGTNCPPKSYARGVDAAGNAEGCTAAVSDHDLGSNSTGVGKDVLVNFPRAFGNTALGNAALRQNTVGSANTANGVFALSGNTTGTYNTAIGARAMNHNDSGRNNTAIGGLSLVFNVDGGFNTATGGYALRVNESGSFNTAQGWAALESNTTGERNTAVGTGALGGLTGGNRNVALGSYALSQATGSSNLGLGVGAGSDLTSGDDNVFIANPGVSGDDGAIRIGTLGTHSRAFVAGIRGVATGVADALPVYVDSAGQLGTASSSRRFKEEIRDMASASDRLLGLRPVTFRYRRDFADGEKPIQFGLIAEEVAEVFPELVVYDEEGRPESVKYHVLSSLVLNELQKQVALSRRQEAELAELRALAEERRRAESELAARVEALERRESELAALAARLAALEQRTSGLPPPVEIADRHPPPDTRPGAR